MASQQQMSRENKTDKRDQGDVPQVTHFESLIVVESGAQPPAVVHRVVETMHGAGGGTHDQSRTQKHQQSGHEARKNQGGPALTTQAKSNKQTTAVKGAHQVGEQVKKNNKGANQAVGLTDTMVDVGKKGTSYIGETAIKGRGIAMETGKTTAQYVGKAAGAAKSAALVAGRGAAGFANETATGVTESMENLNAGVGRVVENTASVTEKIGEKVVGATDTVVDLGKKGAGYIGDTVVAGKDVTLKTGKTAAGYVKDTSLVAGWSAAEIASGTAEGLTASMESLNAGVGGLVEGTTLATENVAQKTFDTVVDTGSYVGEKVVAGKDVSLKTGKATVGYAGKAAGVVKDASLVAGWSAAELASQTATGVTDTMGNLNAGVAGLVEGTALATENVGQKTIDTVVEAGKKGASLVGKGMVAGKDITLGTGKATGEYVGKAAGVVKDAALVGGWSAAELAGETAAGVTESMDIVNEGVAGLVEGAACATENVAQKTFHTMVDVGKKGASYIGEKAVAGKDVTFETGKAAGEYVGKGASVVKDATLVGGWSALELASDTKKGVTESMENVNVGVAGLVENAAVATEVAAEKAKGLKDVAVDVGNKGVSYIGEKGVACKDITMETGRTTAEYVGKATNVMKDASLVAGWSAAELASGATAGVTESMENLNAGVAGIVEGTACATEDVAQRTYGTMADVGKKGASYVGEKAVAGKDIVMDTGKTAAEYVGKAVDVGGGTQFASDTRGESKETLTRGYVTKPKNIVVEKEEITIDYDQRRKIEKKEVKGAYHK